MLTEEIIQTLIVIAGGGFVLILFIRFLVTQALHSGVDTSDTVIKPMPAPFVVEERPNPILHRKIDSSSTEKSNKPTMIEPIAACNNKVSLPNDSEGLSMEEVRRGIIMSEILTPKWVKR